MTTEKTIIHFHELRDSLPTKRTLEVDGHHLHGDVVRMLKESGYEPIENRVMLEYV